MPKDIVVIGAGVGALSAAIYCRLEGHRVLVLEASDRAGGKAASLEVEGFRLDPGPSIVILTRIYRRLFEDAGRRMDDYLTFARLDPISRVYFDGKAIDLPAARESYTDLLGEHAPEDVDAFKILLAKLDKVSPNIDKSVFAHPYSQARQLMDPRLIATALSFNLRLTYRQLVEGMFKSPLLRAFFFGFPSYGGQTYDSKAPGALLIPYLMIQEGVFYPQGGVGAIPAALERLACELGVEFRFNAKAIGFRTSGRRVLAALLESGEAIEAESFISNVDRLTTRSWLGHGTDVPPSFSYFTIHWGFRERIEGLRHHTLVVPRNWERGFEQLYRERAFPDAPIVYLNETAASDPAGAPPGATNLFAVVTSPSREPSVDWAGSERLYRGRLLETLREAGIGIDPANSVFQRVQTPLFFEERHGNYRGSLYGPAEKHRLFGGMFPLRNSDEDYGNLFYCGGSVQPGAGLPMVALSGRFAAGLATR